MALLFHWDTLETLSPKQRKCGTQSGTISKFYRRRLFFAKKVVRKLSIVVTALTYRISKDIFHLISFCRVFLTSFAFALHFFHSQSYFPFSFICAQSIRTLHLGKHSGNFSYFVHHKQKKSCVVPTDKTEYAWTWRKNKMMESFVSRRWRSYLTACGFRYFCFAEKSTLDQSVCFEEKHWLWVKEFALM